MSILEIIGLIVLGVIGVIFLLIVLGAFVYEFKQVAKYERAEKEWRKRNVNPN